MVVDIKSLRYGLDSIVSTLNERATVFIVDAKLGLDATSGYADGECSGQCSENQVLTNRAGDFYLMVQAGDGPWEVVVQEYRRP